jgi:hypothetical protein
VFALLPMSSRVAQGRSNGLKPAFLFILIPQHPPAQVSFAQAVAYLIAIEWLVVPVRDPVFHHQDF